MAIYQKDVIINKKCDVTGSLLCATLLSFLPSSPSTLPYSSSFSTSTTELSSSLNHFKSCASFLKIRYHINNDGAAII